MGFWSSAKETGKDVFKGYDKIKTKEKLNYEELYDIMGAGEYSVGKPELTGKGIMRCIKFPPVDKYVIQVSLLGKTVTISKIYNGASGLLKETAIDSVTHGNYSLLNNESIDMNKATREVGEEISRLLEEKGLLATK